MGSSIINSEERQWHYFDVNNEPLVQYESVYDQLNKYFKDGVPKKIIVKHITGNTSQFDPTFEAILLNEYALKNDPVGIAGHESCHLCMANFTHEASVKEEFRFFDEGFADIFESIINNKTAEYKNESLAVAAIQNLKSNVSFDKVQKWSEYFGDPRTKTNYYAYPVGASFNFFVIDTYGMDKLFMFFKDIGKTQDLAKSIKKVFKSDKLSIETEWQQYLKKVNLSGDEPHIIKMYPANGATNVSIKTDEIFVEFDVPMSRHIFLINNCNDGICYKNAYWKTDKILAVKVILLPNYRYQVNLGDDFHGRFMSKVGIELPVFLWSFETGSE